MNPFHFGHTLHLLLLGLLAVVVGAVQMIHPFMGNSFVMRVLYPIACIVIGTIVVGFIVAPIPTVKSPATTPSTPHERHVASTWNAFIYLAILGCPIVMTIFSMVDRQDMDRVDYEDQLRERVEKINQGKEDGTVGEAFQRLYGGPELRSEQGNEVEER